MNKELLEKKIVDLLNVNEEEKDAVFSLFKNKITAHLKVGEALKIPEIGVFQLKEKLDKADIQQGSEKSSKELTLIFSQETNVAGTDSLFINLELERKTKDDAEFDESVFQLGINKPLATSQTNNLEGDFLSELDEKLNDLIKNSEKLKNFDLWEDHLKSKGSTNIFEEDDGEIENSEPKIDSSIKEKDFVPLDEDEVFDDLIEENEFIQDDELTNLTDEIEIKEPIFEATPENIVEDVLNEIETDDFDLENTQNEFKEMDRKDGKTLGESVLNEINDQIEEQESDDDFDEIIKEQIEKIKESEIVEEEEESQIAKEMKNLNTGLVPTEDREVKYKVNSKRRSPVIYVLIAMFVIVGAIGIYYLFFKDPAWLYDEYEHEVALSERHLKEYEEVKARLEAEESAGVTSGKKERILANDSTKIEVKDSLNKVVDKAKEEIVQIPIKKNEQNNITSKIETQKKSDELTITKSDKVEEKVVSKLNEVGESSENKTYSEKEVSQNIFFDGFIYNVQISSWPKRETAKQQVDKYIKNGYPAFLIKAYIAKFKNHWYRVRIGPYTTLEEAKKAQKEIK